MYNTYKTPGEERRPLYIRLRKMATEFFKLTFCVLSGSICINRPLSPLVKFGLLPFRLEDYRISSFTSGNLAQTIMARVGDAVRFIDVYTPGIGGTIILSTENGNDLMRLVFQK